MKRLSDEALISQAEAARVLGTSHTTVQRLQKDGALTAVSERQGRQVVPRYRRAEVEALAAQWRASDANA